MPCACPCATSQGVGDTTAMSRSFSYELKPYVLADHITLSSLFSPCRLLWAGILVRIRNIHGRLKKATFFFQDLGPALNVVVGSYLAMLPGSCDKVLCHFTRVVLVGLELLSLVLVSLANNHQSWQVSMSN